MKPPCNTKKTNRNRPTFNRVLALLRPHRNLLFLAVIFMTLTAACQGAVVKSLEPLLEEVFEKKDPVMMKLAPALVLLLFSAKGIFNLLQTYFMSKLGNVIVNGLRIRLFAHLQTLSLSFFNRHSSGVLISRVMNDVAQIQNAVGSVTTSLVKEALTAIFLLLVLFNDFPKLTLISLGALPLALYPIIVMARRLKRLAIKGQIIAGELTARLSETLRGIKVTQAYNMSRYEVGRFEKECGRSVDNLMRAVVVRSMASTLMEILGGLCVAVILWYAGYSIVREELTVNKLIVFIAGLLFMYEPLKRLANTNNGLQNGLAAAQRVFEILDTKPDIVSPPDGLVLTRARGELEFKDLSFAYEPQRPVLRGINLKVPKGKMVALVGPSGAGKTTLANLVPRFYDPREGAILLDGRDLRSLDLESLRAQVAVVNQEVILFDDTVRHNIAYGRLSATDEDIRAAAEAAYAHEFIERLPGGYDEVIGESGCRLSGGQRQRLAVARAILKNAPVLILDEATSALDTESEKYVQKALDNLMVGRTSLVIAHRLSTVRHADLIVVLEKGRIKEQGAHQELLAARGLYYNLYQMQFAIQENEQPAPEAPVVGG